MTPSSLPLEPSPAPALGTTPEARGGPLSGMRVLDCSIAMAGPLAAMRLGDLGADVIKIEPVTGEWHRHVAGGGATGNRINASFLSLNRNKRSLAIDLKTQEGREILWELARTADVFLQNYRPGVAERLGVDYETLSALNPEIVYVSMSGYGEDGPYAHRPGQDLLLQAMSGALESVGRSRDAPQPAGQFLVDGVTAYVAFEGALAALLHRERTGEGQLVQVNMLDAILTLQMQELSIFTVGGRAQTRSDEPHGHSYIRSPYGIFETLDGHIALAFPSPRDLAAVLGAPELAALDDEADTWRHRDQILRVTQARLRTGTSADWLAAFEAQGCWAGPVYGYEDVLDDAQVEHNGTFVAYEHPTEGAVRTPGFPIRFSRTPSHVFAGAPLTGEHSRSILAELGHDGLDVDDLIERGVVAEDPL
jgi:crotonobetainyl-CoA:carnitine CoA-transferase CaiB-like acyl-CoA transferase